MVNANTNIAPPASETADATGLTDAKMLGGDDRRDGAGVDAEPELRELIAQRHEFLAQAALVLGDLDHKLAHRERGDEGRQKNDGEDDRDRARKCESVPHATPLQRPDHRPDGEGDEKPEHHRDNERSHLAEAQHRDENEHEAAERRKGTGGSDQPVPVGHIVAAISGHPMPPLARSAQRGSGVAAAPTAIMPCPPGRPRMKATSTSAARKANRRTQRCRQRAGAARSTARSASSRLTTGDALGSGSCSSKRAGSSKPRGMHAPAGLEVAARDRRALPSTRGRRRGHARAAEQLAPVAPPHHQQEHPPDRDRDEPLDDPEQHHGGRELLCHPRGHARQDADVGDLGDAHGARRDGHQRRDAGDRHRREHGRRREDIWPDADAPEGYAEDDEPGEPGDTAAANPRRPCCVRMVFERSRRSSMPSTMLVGGVFRNSVQIRRATPSSQPPSFRARLSSARWRRVGVSRRPARRGRSAQAELHASQSADG